MILSMTGFGRAETTLADKKIIVEIKSLNSKGIDLGVRLPTRFKDKEFEIRKILSEKILRGKADCYIGLESEGAPTDIRLNKAHITAYMAGLQELAPNAPAHELLKIAVKMPDTITTKAEETTEEEWDGLKATITEALKNFENFRETEGQILQEELNRNLAHITDNLSRVAPYEDIRLEGVKARYRKTLNEFADLDETRFYQEMAYYTEKLDIQEEKVRLSQHLKYYREVMQNEELNGKKLGFIAQEIGREINTLGSKANHADIQKLVVEMKDDLEKIKEQTLNVL